MASKLNSKQRLGWLALACCLLTASLAAQDLPDESGESPAPSASAVASEPAGAVEDTTTIDIRDAPICWGCHSFMIPDPNGGPSTPCTACFSWGTGTGCLEFLFCGCVEFFPGQCSQC